MSEKRTGTPIQSPFARRKFEKSRSSHDLLSPLNTLDSKITTSVPLPPKKSENPLSRSYSSTFPLKTKGLPGAYKSTPDLNNSSYDVFKNIIEKYPSDTFCSEKDALSSVTKSHLNVLSDSEDEDEKATVKNDSNEFSKSFYSKSERKRPIESFFNAYIPDPPSKPSTASLNAPLNTFIKPKHFPTLLVSNVQYRSIMLPNSSKDDQNLKLIFVPNDKIVSLVNCKNNNVTIPFSKISRVQFIRNVNLASSDWYIDFVIIPLTSLNFEPFGIFSNFTTAESIAYEDCNTFRINLANNCGLSIDSIEGLLMSLLRDRNAFYFTTKRDPYGEFEKSNNAIHSNSPKRQITPQSSKSIRVVPSLESLSTSDSVKISPSLFKRSSNSIFQSKLYSPDIFERRTSKRLRSPSQESPKNSEDTDTVHIDPNLESERIILFTYPEGELDSVYVTSHELERLAPKVWLNDTNIDFELKFLLSQLDQTLRDKIHVFSSFFYRRLSSAKLTLTPSQDGTKSGYDLVKSWTRKVNLFEKDFLIVPICENLHWFLAIICYPSKMLAELIEDDKDKEMSGVKEEDNKDEDENREATSDDDAADDTTLVVDLDPEPIESTKIFIFDSLGLASRGKGVAVINRLRTYLQLEAEDKLKRESSKSACSGNIIKVPQQENYNDCGCFLLQFAEEFVLSISKGIVNKIQEKNNDMSDWFPSSLAQSRRNIMRERVEQLAQDFAHREKLKNISKPPEEEHEDRSSDIEEIVMITSK